MTVQDHMLAAEAHLMMAEQRIPVEHINAFEAENLELAKQYLELAIRSGVEMEVQETMEHSAETQRKD